MNGKISEIWTGMEPHRHGIIAAYPMIDTPGYLPRAVVVRALDGANTPADDFANPVKYVVHTLAIQDNGRVSFDRGDYIHADAPATNPEEALSWALAKANRRACDMLGVEDPLRKAAIDLLQDGSDADTYDEDGNDVTVVEISVEKYRELQHVLARLTGTVYGPKFEE